MVDVSPMLLRQSVCNAQDRIPGPAFPFYSETRKCTIALNGTSCSLDFEADRDLLLTDMSIAVENAVDGTNVAAFVDIEYCNTVLAQHTFVQEFDYCCARKPIFLLGVKEGKHLRTTITLAAPAGADGVNVEVTLSGFQGNGCCG